MEVNCRNEGKVGRTQRTYNGKLSSTAHIEASWNRQKDEIYRYRVMLGTRHRWYRAVAKKYGNISSAGTGAYWTNRKHNNSENNTTIYKGGWQDWPNTLAREVILKCRTWKNEWGQRVDRQVKNKQALHDTLTLHSEISDKRTSNAEREMINTYWGQQKKQSCNERDLNLIRRAPMTDQGHQKASPLRNRQERPISPH